MTWKKKIEEVEEKNQSAVIVTVMFVCDTTARVS